MNTFATLELLEHGRKATIYTVKLEHDDDSDEISETDKFFTNFESHESYGDDLAEITSQITIISRRGLRGIQLRAENGAFALPSKDGKICSTVFFPNPSAYLRLYCIVVSDEVIVLCNGGVKDVNQVQDSGIIGHFRLANQLEGKLNEYLRDLPRPLSRSAIEIALKDFDVLL